MTLDFDIHIKPHLKAQSVIRLEIDGVEGPHFFVCVGIGDDSSSLSVLCTSQEETINRHIRRNFLREEDVVFIRQGYNTTFTKDTFVRCNYIHEIKLEHIKKQFQAGKLTLCTDIDDSKFEEILLACKESPDVINDHKDKIEFTYSNLFD